MCFWGEMVKGEAALWTRCLALQTGGSAWSAPFLEIWKRIAEELVGLQFWLCFRAGCHQVHPALLPPVLTCGNVFYRTLEVTLKLEMASTVEMDSLLCLN